MPSATDFMLTDLIDPLYFVSHAASLHVSGGKNPKRKWKKTVMVVILSK